ncbi:MAG: aminotransferase class IV, partial [Flavisolibacter sp.]
MAIWLQPLIKKNNADDVLYQNNDIVSECPRSNFFIVTKDNVIVTPGKNILKGISRMKLIEIAGEYFEVHERDVTTKDIMEAKEAFISSTTKLILPVNRIDEKVFDTMKPVTAKLFEIFELSVGAQYSV